MVQTPDLNPEAFAAELRVKKYYAADTAVWEPYKAKYGMRDDDLVKLATDVHAEVLHQRAAGGRPLGTPGHKRGLLTHFINAYVKDGLEQARGGSPDGIELGLIEPALKSDLRVMVETRKGVEDGTQLANAFIRDLKRDLNADIAARLGRPFP